MVDAMYRHLRRVDKARDAAEASKAPIGASPAPADAPAVDEPMPGDGDDDDGEGAEGPATDGDDGALTPADVTPARP